MTWCPFSEVSFDNTRPGKWQKVLHGDEIAPGLDRLLSPIFRCLDRLRESRTAWLACASVNNRELLARADEERCEWHTCSPPHWSATEDEEPCSDYEGGWTPMRNVSRRSRDAIVGPQRPILGHPAMEKNSGNRTTTSDWDETGRARREVGCDGRDAFGRTMQRSNEGVAKIGQLSKGKATGVEGNWGRAGSVRIGRCRVQKCDRREQ
ncbi:hypothetical protein CMUS01_08618 [Colletotrichum musicola]|uniref:Uncharacterized protein n=1 Tax=Colletotrichum musicola TaxID=2175873 RepID=A0A8H6KBQ7_9PEZI|nr:hypothetical protein CMUS01_08618 [Colletotrichum musicola]